MQNANCRSCIVQNQLLCVYIQCFRQLTHQVHPYVRLAKYIIVQFSLLISFIVPAFILLTIELVPSIMTQMSTPFSLVSRSLTTERIPLVFTLDLVMLLACTSYTGRDVSAIFDIFSRVSCQPKRG